MHNDKYQWYVLVACYTYHPPAQQEAHKTAWSLTEDTAEYFGK